MLWPRPRAVRAVRYLPDVLTSVRIALAETLTVCMRPSMSMRRR
jgi:hypothetical protein